MKTALEAPEKIPFCDKVVWDYSDCFGDYKVSKLCFAFLHKNYEIGMHYHEFYEINIIESGIGYHYSRNGKMPVKRGDVFIIPPKAMHGYYNCGSLNVYHILVQKLFFEKYFQDLQLSSSFKILFDLNSNKANTEPIHMVCNDEVEFMSIEKSVLELNHSIHDSVQPNIQNIDFVKSYIKGMEIIVKLCELYSNQNKNASLDTKQRIYNCVEYLYSNYDKKMDINKLCTISCMSRSSLFTEFKKIIGLTPNDFLTDYRMKLSKRMLEESDDSIADIATKVGYYDSSHFEKMYKKYYGCLPKENRIQS